MQTVRLRQTQVPGVYWGDDCRLYELMAGSETKCCRCEKWTQSVFRWGQEKVCERHVRVANKTRLRVTTTFALRVYRDGAEGPPAGVVVRRGDDSWSRACRDARGSTTA